MRRGQGTLGPYHKNLPVPNYGVLVQLWYCACVLLNEPSRGTRIQYHNTLFHIVPTMLYSLIFTLYVCLTVMAEWSKALVGPGSHLANCKFIFSFFLLFSRFYRLIVFLGSLRTDLGSFFGEIPYRDSATSRVSFACPPCWLFRENHLWIPGIGLGPHAIYYDPRLITTLIF